MRTKGLIFPLLVVSLLLFFTPETFPQIIRPTGISTKASSQLIYIYDSFGEGEAEFAGSSGIQVTNTNDTEGVWIHVQIFRSFDPDFSLGASGDDGGIDFGPEPPVICDERNFIDFLTPNDTHAYNILEDPETLFKNQGESENQEGEQVNIDLLATKGFIVITPVVSESDLTAISFQHLTGNFYINFFNLNVNAMGRDAVDFSTGEILPDNTPLDGQTGGFVVLQPEEFLTDFGSSDSPPILVQMVAIVFEDIYGPPGLLGYLVAPATAQWNSFIFDFKEDPTSCGIKTIECFDDFGLNQTFTQYNPFLGDDLLCSSTTTPEHPFTGQFGWLRVFVSGLDSFVNHLAFFATPENFIGGKWMFTK